MEQVSHEFVGKNWLVVIRDANGKTVVADMRQSWIGAGAKAVADERMGEFLARADMALRANEGPPLAAFAGWVLTATRVDDELEFADSCADDFLPPAIAA